MDTCMMCGKDMPDYEPKMCCSGRECGCMGMPTNPPICSDECWDRLMNRRHRWRVKLGVGSELCNRL